MAAASNATANDVDKRDRRAAEEAMVVVPDAPGLYEVYSGTRACYRVDLLAAACECKAAKYQEGKCKHARRVEMAIGERSIPAGVRVDRTLALRRR